MEDMLTVNSSQETMKSEFDSEKKKQASKQTNKKNRVQTPNLQSRHLTEHITMISLRN